MSISRYPVPDLDELPPDLAGRIREIASKTGFVPNVFLALAHRPDELRAFMSYHDAVMERQGGLTKADREMIVVATSAQRGCPYCVVAHGAVLRIRARDPRISDWVAVNYRRAPITARQMAMLDYAVKLSAVPEEVGEEDLDRLRTAGFDQEEIWDIASVVALFALSNRMALALDIQPNQEFFMMARVPREQVALTSSADLGGPPKAADAGPTTDQKP
ncbi:MAG: peroxidase-related enzyme [Candidatus Dormibacteria bacterium]